MWKAAVFFLAFCLVQCSSQKYRNVDILEADMIRNTYLRVEKSLWDSISDSSKNQDLRLKSIFFEHNQFVNNYLKNYLEMDDLKMLINLNGWTQLQSEFINIHRMFVSFEQHLARESKFIDKGGFNEDVSLDLVEHVLDESHWSLNETLENLHRTIVQDKLYIDKISFLTGHSCQLQRSSQQIIHQLYDAIVVMELKAFIMMQCSFMLRTVYQRGDSTKQATALRKEFERKIVESLETSFNIFELSSRSVVTCDPETFIEGENYLQITRLLQGHIENEADLNRERSCLNTCPNFQYVQSTFGCTEDSICNRQPKCQGKLVSCRSFNDDMWICPGGKNDLRRYEYITYDDGSVLGKAKPCPSNGFHLERYWWRGVYHCDHCLCICDEQGKKSDRFFSLRPMKSDTKNNMVVTGLRFIKNNRIIHLQIQEGQLMEFGKINVSSVAWVPYSSFTLLDKGIKDGVDYHTLSYDRREIDLDDLTAPAGYVVTGAKLRRLGNHLNLEIRVSEINFRSGKIIDTEKGFWVSNENTEVSIGDERRSQVNMGRPDIPTKTREPSRPISSSNSFIKFTHSDVNKDLAQTTVPFLDAQDVVTDPPMPLQGVGIYYKGQYGYGGFVAPKISTFDFSPFIKANQQNFKTSNNL